jgi:hypothetical protein
MRYVHAKPIAFHLRTWLLSGLIVLIVGAAGCSQPAVSQQVETPAAEDGIAITMPYQADAFPRERIEEGHRAVAPFLGDALVGDGFISKENMQQLQLHMVLPSHTPDTERLDNSYIDQMSLTLVGPAASGTVAIEQEFGVSTDLERGELQGETVIHGVIYGTLLYPDDSRAEITVSGAAIVERQQGRFNIIIDDHNDIEGVAFQVGDLEWTEELDEVVYPDRPE